MGRLTHHLAEVRDGGRVEVFVEAIDLAVADQADDAGVEGDALAVLAGAGQAVQLDKAAGKGVQAAIFVVAIGDAPNEAGQRRDVVLERLHQAVRVVPDLDPGVVDLARLCGWADERGIDLPDLEVVRPRLEDVYLELTAATRPG